jgi:hypothetical protein
MYIPAIIGYKDVYQDGAEHYAYIINLALLCILASSAAAAAAVEVELVNSC